MGTKTVAEDKDMSVLEGAGKISPTVGFPKPSVAKESITFEQLDLLAEGNISKSPKTPGGQNVVPTGQQSGGTKSLGATPKIPIWFPNAKKQKTPTNNSQDQAFKFPDEAVATDQDQTYQKEKQAMLELIKELGEEIKYLRTQLNGSNLTNQRSDGYAEDNAGIEQRGKVDCGKPDAWSLQQHTPKVVERREDDTAVENNPERRYDRNERYGLEPFVEQQRNQEVRRMSWRQGADNRPESIGRRSDQDYFERQREYVDHDGQGLSLNDRWNRQHREQSQEYINRRNRIDYHDRVAGNDHQDYGQRDECDYRNSNRRQRDYRSISDFEIQSADRRMEKWHLTFSGDSRQRSLEDFLHKVRRLARMDRISDDVLLQRIHTILRGEAYDWYLCYSDEFVDWDNFEEQIRYMYGNPNKDQGNRQRIYERKQLRNETFLTFKMDIERLNKLLSTPLDQQRIYEVIWDNMRPHYRSRLACRTVLDLRELEYYAYRIDANDPAFKQSREGAPRTSNAIHNIEVENDQEDPYSSCSEDEEVNVVDKRFDRDRRVKEQQVRQSQTNRSTAARDGNGERQEQLCWNCRKTGHLWRQCTEQKRMFCYICGNLGKTTVTCTSHSRNGQPSEN